MIPLDEPVFKGNEKKYVNECFKKGWISWQGEYVKKFENKFSSIVGCKYATSTANGTDALIIALKALDIKKGDELSYDYGFSFDESFKDYPCRCNSKNCCGYIVKQASRWRVKKSLRLSK